MVFVDVFFFGKIKSVFVKCLRDKKRDKNIDKPTVNIFKCKISKFFIKKAR